jgi:hypothetical protein
MSYNDLPIEDRIRLASEYAVILIADDRPDIDIIAELQENFQLTEEQAKTAYFRMRQVHSEDFQLAIKQKIKRGWTAVLVCFLFGISCAAFAPEAGWFYFVMVFIFGMGFSFGLVMIAKWTRESKTSPEEGFFSVVDRQKELMKNKEGDWTYSIPVLLLFLLTIVWFFFSTGNRIVNINEIQAVNNMEITRPAEKRFEHSGKSSRIYYYLIYFKGHQHNFKLYETYYNYADKRISHTDYTVGDMVSIEIRQKQMDELLDTIGKHTIKMVNLTSDGKWLIDHAYRNKRITKENKQTFLILAAGFIVANLVVFLWLRYRKFSKKQD